LVRSDITATVLGAALDVPSRSSCEQMEAALEIQSADQLVKEVQKVQNNARVQSSTRLRFGERRKREVAAPEAMAEAMAEEVWGEGGGGGGGGGG
jgi:hypothetical protein